jgi:hypothetical protein
VKEIEVYFTDDENTYILKVEDIIKDKNYSYKILLSYNNVPYKKYLQGGQILNGNLETVFSYYNIRGNKLRPFRLSEDGTYWIGITNKGEEFYFNGEYSEEIMKYNWRISNGYVVRNKISQNDRENKRLNRIVLNITDKNIMVNHIGGNKMDNRIEKLSISNHEDNMKELLPSSLNNTGITGLMLNEKNKKYSISCSINGVAYTRTYNDKDTALIDLLIVQRHYGYRHNENLYYMLENFDNEYINKLIEMVENKIKNKMNRKINPIICKNRFELSEDGSFYYMYDKKNNKCKISIEDLEMVKQGNWRYTLNNGKEYFGGDIIWNGKRKGIYLHRFLFNLVDHKYRHWYIDHFDGDGLNNIRENMVITDAEGNGINKKGENIEFMNGRYMFRTQTKKITEAVMFDTFDEAKAYKNFIMEKLMSERLQFKSKEELDKYIKTKIE